MDIADIRVDTRISVLRPLHAKVIMKSYLFFQSEDGENIANGWKGSGILSAVSECRNMNWESLLDPFAALSL